MFCWFVWSLVIFRESFFICFDSKVNCKFFWYVVVVVEIVLMEVGLKCFIILLVMVVSIFSDDLVFMEIMVCICVGSWFNYIILRVLLDRSLLLRLCILWSSWLGFWLLSLRLLSSFCSWWWLDFWYVDISCFFSVLYLLVVGGFRMMLVICFRLLLLSSGMMRLNFCFFFILLVVMVVLNCVN